MNRFLLILGALSVGACYQSSGAGDDAGVGDGGARPDVGFRADAGAPVDAPRDVGPVDSAQCALAPLIAANGRVDVTSVDHAIPPAPGTCWDGDGAMLYYRLEIPPGRGVELVTRGESAPVTDVVHGCAAPAGADRCQHFGPSGFFSPDETERRWFHGNTSSEVQSIIIAVWWAGDPTPFSLETQLLPLAENADCRAPRPLAEGTLLPPTGQRGGTYESWDCWFLPESVFYTLPLPARSVALPLEGAQPLVTRWGCTCDAAGEHADSSLNLTDAPRDLMIEANPLEPVGVRIAPLPENAFCDGALALTLDGAPRSLLPYPRSIADHDRCVTNDIGWFSVDVPAGATVEVTAMLSTPYPEIGIASGCEATCEPHAFDRQLDGSVVTRLENDGAAPRTQWIAVGYDGPDMPTFTGTVRARLLR